MFYNKSSNVFNSVMELEVYSDPICILPTSIISYTGGKTGSFTQYPETDPVNTEQLIAVLLPESRDFLGQWFLNISYITIP